MNQASGEAKKPRQIKGRNSRELISLLTDQNRESERQVLGLNQKRAARRLGYTEEHLSRLVNGRANCGPKFEKRAARLLHQLRFELLQNQAQLNENPAKNKGLGSKTTGRLFAELKEPEITRPQPLVSQCPNCGYLNLNQTATSIVEALKADCRTSADVAARLKISENRAATYLRQMAYLGIIEREKTALVKGGVQWEYRLSKEF